MISKETIEVFSEKFVDTAESYGYVQRPWNRLPANTKEAIRRSVTEAFLSIGVKVEGEKGNAAE